MIPPPRFCPSRMRRPIDGGSAGVSVGSAKDQSVLLAGFD